MEIKLPEPEYKCSKCGSLANHKRTDKRMILTVCDGCGHESITDFLPEPEPWYEKPEGNKSWTAKPYKEF